MSVSSGRRACTSPVWKQATVKAPFRAGADTEDHRKDVLQASEFYLSDIRAMYFHVAICPSIAATYLRRSFQIFGTAAKISHGCVTAANWKVNVASVGTNRYAAGVGAEHTPALVIIWPKNLFALMCRLK
jgi:hypothetical protein